MKGRLWAVGAVAALVTLTACGSSSSSTTPSVGPPSAPASGSQVKLMSTGIGTVLATSSGHTIYWFAIDTPTESKCTGACATFWPPVKGPVTAAAGTTLPAKFGTITRSDGTTQATYMGHPLYTYSGDSAAGQTTGNGLNISGGLWYAMTPTGAKPGKANPSPSSSSSSGGGGYGY
jgi:predicted lipoprotein with Yx(FWY)xxD motif